MPGGYHEFSWFYLILIVFDGAVHLVKSKNKKQLENWRNAASSVKNLNRLQKNWARSRTIGFREFKTKCVFLSVISHSPKVFEFCFL